MNNLRKPIVFAIIPFSDDFLALYDALKEKFKDEFEFTNAGDLDNQQNVLRDIVVGISKADVIIADLTGLNANVFYELGLAHAMNKKVIIITQDISELPFDIKSYRANEYSLQFNKISKLFLELEKLLKGAIDGSTQYGNPVSDYIPDFFQIVNVPAVNYKEDIDILPEDEAALENIESGESGFLDFIADIVENTDNMNAEITAIGNELNDMNDAITDADSEIKRVKMQSGNADASFVRNVCRNLAAPVDLFARKLKVHVNSIIEYWGTIENNYLLLLDNDFTRKEDNIQSIKDNMQALVGMQSAIYGSDEKIEGLINAAKGCLGMERRLNKAITSLIAELDAYLLMTDTMCSSIDRIIAKGETVL